MPEPQSGGETAAGLTARTEREYLENRVVELEAETDELRRGLDGLAARVHFLRGELDRLGRVVRVGAAVRGAIRQPARLPGLPGELRRLVRGVPIPTDPPLAERRRTLAELAAAHRARVVEQVGRRQGAAPTPRPLASLRVGLVADEALDGLDASDAARAGAVIVIGTTLPVWARHGANIVLPIANCVEEDGTFTNLRGRVQRFLQAKAAPGLARPSFLAIGDLLAAMGEGQGYWTASQAFDALAASHAAFAGMSYDKLALKGAVAASAMAGASR